MNLYRPRTSSDFESHSFPSAVPTIWNSLSVTTIRLLIALVLLDLDLKLTYLQKPMSPNVSVTKRL